MSKSNLRKITVDPTKCNTDSRRPSVFERLGTKPITSSPTAITSNPSDYCRNWALNGSCSYGKTCKYASTHTLISPSKRAKKDNCKPNIIPAKEDVFKRVTGKLGKKSPDLNLEDWNQTDLEYEDEKVLERRRQLLQRELELQMKKDKEVHGKDNKIKHKKKAMTSSSSSHSSTSSSSSSSSSSDDSSSSSTSDSRKKVKKIKAKRQQSVSSDYEEDKDRKRKLKLKRLASKSEKLPIKKKRKVETPSKKETLVKSVKKVATTVRKHSIASTKSPVIVSSKSKERNRSGSPKAKQRECDRERHHRKGRDSEDTLSSKDSPTKAKTSEKSKDEKSKTREHEEKLKFDERSKSRLKDKDRRSRTPPIDRSKHQMALTKRRSRTPEKSRSKHSPGARHEKFALKIRDEKKEREAVHKLDRNKDDRKEPKPRLSSPERKPRDSDDAAHERARARSRERREKEREERSHARVREKEREEARERARERERDKEPLKPREVPLVALSDKNSRYGREKERGKDPKDEKMRRNERGELRSDLKPTGRFDVKYTRALEKPTERERFRERSLERASDKSELYDRGGRHRRLSGRYERGHSTERKESSKLEHRESPRRALDDRSFDRERYTSGRVSAEHWEAAEDAPARPLDYHEDKRRKERRFSPFSERRGRDERPASRYAVSAERGTFDEQPQPHHHHYEKIRPRDESSGDNWDVHHDVEQSRDRPVYPAEWEEREWRGLWDRESLPRSEDDWAQRYDSPMSDWKINDSRKWEAVHLRGNYRERVKNVEPDAKRRAAYSTPDVREDCASHGSKQSSLHGSMKEEPINKKLMELAEGRARRSREKSVDSSHKKKLSEPKEEVKRPDEPPESDLSDISDDPDDILNMEDEETPAFDAEKEPKVVVSEETPGNPISEAVDDVDKEDDTLGDDDNMETMDFEEISDGELEEDIKTSGKGLGDALGVDWESLVKESQPRRPPVDGDQSIQSRWQCRAVFQRIGVSVDFAGREFVDKIIEKYCGDDKKTILMHDVAMIHTAMFREKISRDSGFNFISSDDSLYCISQSNVDSDDSETLKPFTSLFDEAKLLLQM